MRPKPLSRISARGTVGRVAPRLGAAQSGAYVERQNLNMRMGIRRFTRLTNAFSKKLENHRPALALYFMFYNFCRIHKSLSGIMLFFDRAFSA